MNIVIAKNKYIKKYQKSVWNVLYLDSKIDK